MKNILTSVLATIQLMILSYGVLSFFYWDLKLYNHWTARIILFIILIITISYMRKEYHKK